MKENSATYRSWVHMRNRCNNSNNKDYPFYGGRGITVDLRWNSFAAFKEDMGDCPPGMTIERKDVNGHYTKDNCRWATRKEQSRNARSNRNITLNGRTQPLSAWCEELGQSYAQARGRLRRGWRPDQIFVNK